MTKRISEYPIHPLFLNRWSARAMSGEPIRLDELMTLFEAAKWAPSSFNNQPWRFIYATLGTHEWAVFFDLLNPYNKSWSFGASVLVVVLARRNFEYNNLPSKTHSYDVGAACQNLALQGALSSLVVHAIEGFDYDRARVALNVPDEYAIEVMFALGRPGKVEELPEQLREREYPSGRKSLSELVFKGTFPQKCDE